jgi:HNH endonuclease
MAASASTRNLVRERAAGLCEYCHAQECWQFVRFTLDHIVPRSAEVNDEPDNLALACRNCNERRSDRCETPDPDGGVMVPLFNPRADHWNDHFAWDSSRTRIVGLTPTGRATIDLLDCNDERHDGHAVRIRERDVADGYHPPPGDPVLAE